jgi:hypothetical protein
VLALASFVSAAVTGVGVIMRCVLVMAGPAHGQSSCSHQSGHSCSGQAPQSKQCAMAGSWQRRQTRCLVSWVVVIPSPYRVTYRVSSGRTRMQRHGEQSTAPTLEHTAQHRAQHTRARTADDSARTTPKPPRPSSVLSYFSGFVREVTLFSASALVRALLSPKNYRYARVELCYRPVVLDVAVGTR